LVVILNPAGNVIELPLGKLAGVGLISSIILCVLLHAFWLLTTYDEKPGRILPRQVMET